MAESTDPLASDPQPDEARPGAFGAVTEHEIHQVAPFGKLAAEATAVAVQRGEELLANLTGACRALTTALQNLDAEEDEVASQYRLRRKHLTTQLRGVQAALAVVQPQENGGPTVADMPTQLHSREDPWHEDVQ